ncbi:MAG: archease [Patescibacteria group bacterium]
MPSTIIDHTADVRMKIEAPTLEGIFIDALHGMMDVLYSSRKGVKENKGSKRIIALHANDSAVLLVDFLNEVLAQAYLHHEIYSTVTFHAFSVTSLKAEISGIHVDHFDEDIKAVTYHEANVVQEKEGRWKATLIFDI